MLNPTARKTLTRFFCHLFLDLSGMIRTKIDGFRAFFFKETIFLPSQNIQME